MENGILINEEFHELVFCTLIGSCRDCSIFNICSDKCKGSPCINLSPKGDNGIYVNRGKVNINIKDGILIDRELYELVPDSFINCRHCSLNYICRNKCGNDFPCNIFKSTEKVNGMYFYRGKVEINKEKTI